MEVSSIKEIFTFFSSDLWKAMQELFITGGIISIISVLFTQAIKITDENVFTGLKANSVVMWVINLCFVILFSIFFVFVFDGKNGLLLTILYILIIILFSWSLSILLYTHIIKHLLDLLEIGKLKLDGIKLNSESIVNKTKILNNEIKKELLLTEITQDKK
jgi:hypothetical protein